jgi:hypothetical protein
LITAGCRLHILIVLFHNSLGKIELHTGAGVSNLWLQLWSRFLQASLATVHAKLQLAASQMTLLQRYK